MGRLAEHQRRLEFADRVRLGGTRALAEDVADSLSGKDDSLARTGPTRANFLSQLSKYFGVSFTQTFVEFGVFAALHGLGLPANVANCFAIPCSASYNFLMNRNITFKASSNFTRSVILFICLACFNLAFSTTALSVLPGLLGWSTTLVKLLTMACQGCWGFLLCRHVIFR